MQIANDNAQEAGAALVIVVQRELGGGPLPMPAEQLASCVQLRLEPYVGEPVCEPGEAEAQGYAGAIPYDAELPAPAQQRVLALACALHIVRTHGYDADDAELVEYVACALCGLPRGVVATVPQHALLAAASR